MSNGPISISGAELRVTLSPVGARCCSLAIREDRAFADVILARDGNLPGNDGGFMGDSVGRFANRIAQGRFTLDRTPHQLQVNDGRHHLHGGENGFGRRHWQIAVQNGLSVRFGLQSEDGDQGYPGNLSASVDYTVVKNGVDIAYSAETDAPTIMNMTNHNYYNLAQAEGGLAIDQDLTIHADTYLPIDEELIPTGEVAPVDGSPFDFRKAARIADRLGQDHVQLRRAGGFDHNFVITGKAGEMRAMARLFDPQSGRAMEISGDAPGLQFYAGQFLDRVERGPGTSYRRYEGICLEPQNFPDAPNRTSFPNAVLRPGETYRNRIELRFTTGGTA